jgi:membrane-associated phospholipid phosphatase
MPDVITAPAARRWARIVAFDVLTGGYLVSIGLLATVFAARLTHWWWYPLSHALLVLALGLFLRHLPPTPSGWVRFVRWWYPVFLIPLIFTELQWLVHPINPVDIDPQLIAIDYALFGVHPTLWLERFTVPWLTEYMQLAYMAFYGLPLVLCVPLYRQGRWPAFRVSMCAMLLGYYGSYWLYFLTPARGPRFYLAADQTIPLTGLWLTTPMRTAINTLEGVQRDAFPSGHTAIALIILVMAGRYQPRLFYPLLVVTVSLMVSTVYLRYHYVIDVVAGVLLAAVCLGVTFRICREPEGETRDFPGLRSYPLSLRERVRVRVLQSRREPLARLCRRRAQPFTPLVKTSSRGKGRR